jgi:hypothetical protein
MHAIKHLLTPGTPTYALLKVFAVGAVFALAARAGKRPPS